MRRAFLLISVAWLLHAVAWFLPVIDGGVKFPHGLPGWEAFRVAASPLWPYETIQFDQRYQGVLSIISAVTTLLLVLGSPWIVALGTRALRQAAAWTAIFAFIINAHWYVLSGTDRKDLRIGYFVWWLSFFILGLGLFDLANRKRKSLDTATETSADPPR